MKRFYKRLGTALMVSILLTGLVHFTFGSTGFAASEPYKIGAVFSVTGVGSFLGEPEKKTAEMIRDQVNKAGGINGHPIELIVMDDESDTTKCVLAVKKLIKRDDVPVIIGPTRSGESIAAASAAEEAQVPLISCATSYKIVTPIESRKWVFKVAGSDSHVVGRMYDYMKAKGIKKVAIMTDSTGYGASGREELIPARPRLRVHLGGGRTLRTPGHGPHGPVDQDPGHPAGSHRELAPSAPLRSWR